MTEIADPNEILKDSLITERKWKMTSADVLVDLVDASTWSGVGYNPLVDLVHQKIASRALLSVCPQQNYLFPIFIFMPDLACY